MALKNQPFIISHPANSAHFHSDIITTPCHTKEMEATDSQPGHVCHSVYVCVCGGVGRGGGAGGVKTTACLLLLLILKALHKQVFKTAVRWGEKGAGGGVGEANESERARE